jgi:type IV secretion system protein TrbG
LRSRIPKTTRASGRSNCRAAGARETGEARGGGAPAIIAVEKVNFDYTIRGGHEHIRPLRVFDDGAKTYIQMPSELQYREAPVLLVVGKDGKGK